MRDDRARLRDILVATDRILAETTEGRDAFRHDAKLQVWVLYHLQVPGEVCRGGANRSASGFRTRPGRMRIGLRNILIHHYFEIDRELVWQVVEGDLDSLRRVVESANLLIASRQVERAGRAARYL